MSLQTFHIIEIEIVYENSNHSYLNEGELCLMGCRLCMCTLWLMKIFSASINHILGTTSLLSFKRSIANDHVWKIRRIGVANKLPFKF